MILQIGVVFQLADDACRCLGSWEQPAPYHWAAAEGDREPAQTLPFELYLGLQEFAALKIHFPQQSQDKGLALAACYEWFSPAVERWLQVTKAKALHRVRAAIALGKNMKKPFKTPFLTMH
jgi:hypothetical protein